MPIKDLENKETPIESLFGDNTHIELEQQIIQPTNSGQRIETMKNFLLGKLNNKITIDNIIKMTVDALL